jgi:hypothetical protein
MPRRTFATWLFDELAQRRAPLSAPRISDPQSTEIPSACSDAGSARTVPPGLTVGTLLYLSSLGVVATATTGVFFGIGFLLLAHPREEMTAVFSARYNGVEVELPRSDLFPLPDTDALPATASAHLVAPVQALGASEAVPPASAIPGASSNREISPSAEAPLAPPAVTTQAKRAGVGRHRHEGTRRHWAAGSRPGAIGRWPPAVSGPEQAWRWIVRSANNLLASLSPPRSWQAPGPKVR